MGARHYLWMPAVLAGCSIIYNPDNLPVPTDAMEIDVPLDSATDANPELLDLTGVSPTTIDEGVGAGGGRPAIFVLEGTSIVGEAQVAVELMGTTETAMLEGFDATPDGARGGVIVRIPVMPDVDAGETATLRITITQGEVTKMQDVTVNGLDELTLATATMNSNALAARYSQIAVTSNIHFTGATPVKLRATAGVTVDMRLDGDASGVNAGPHGCNGGAVDGPGGCAASGGRQGANTTALGLGAGGGGGGGGFGAQGNGGAGANSGAGGDPSGNDMLVPIDSVSGVAGNRGNGGGGGGTGTLQAGGVGGGGGGVILIEAGGDITVGASGSLRSAGGNGVGNGGSGGGGSGGAILVRAGGTIASTGAWLSAPAGMGGTGNNAGGNGSVGRIRVDSAGGDVPSMATNPPAVRGPAWSAAIPALTTTSPITLAFRGQPGRAFDLRLNDQPMGTATPGVAGTVDVTGVVLRPGRNEICGAAVGGQLLAEALSCIELFYAGN